MRSSKNYSKSTEDCKIDAESFFLDKINGIILKACWVETVKNMIGLQAVSQIWEALPAWYVWMTDAQGVYKIQLAHAEQLDDHGHHLNGIFTVKCFPFPHKAVFKTFSPQERALRTSELFDETGTPKFEQLDQLPEDAFNVAMIECEMQTDGASSLFTLESLSTLRTVDEAAPGAEPQVQRRCVPGWRLGRTFFNWLLAVYAYESRTAPRKIRLLRSPGFETVQTISRNVAYRDCLDIHCYTASVDFGQSSDSPYIGNSLQDDCDVLLDCTCSNHERPHHSFFKDVSDLFLVDELWWSLAHTDYPSQLGSTCGCSGHHDHSHHCHRPTFSSSQRPFST